MAIVGVIPAAGYATRLQPIDCSKEVYPIQGRPVMDYLVERMIAGGASELRVVTRSAKEDVLARAEHHGAAVILGEPPSLGDSLRLGLEGLDSEDIALIGFPDSIWEPVDGYAHLVPLLDVGWDVALGLFRPSATDLPRHEPVLADPTGRVKEIEFKPAQPSSEWTWGIAAARAGALEGLGDEPEPGRLFDSLSRQGLVVSLKLSEHYLDMGTHEGVRRAGDLSTEH